MKTVLALSEIIISQRVVGQRFERPLCHSRDAIVVAFD